MHKCKFVVKLSHHTHTTHTHTHTHMRACTHAHTCTPHRKYECRCILPLIQSAVKLLNVDERAPGISKLFEVLAKNSLEIYQFESSTPTVNAHAV